MKQRQRFLHITQDHLSSILLARNLIGGQVANTGPRIPLPQKLEITKKMYADRLRYHFEAEELILFPAMKKSSDANRRMLDELIAEHEQIRAIASTLYTPISIHKTLHDFGYMLELHIIHEEKFFQQHIIPNLPEDVLKDLEEGIERYFSDSSTPKR